MLLLVAFPDRMQWLYWVPTIGTWAQLIFGYCTMARCVSLLPWNRSEPFTPALVARTFFSRPVRGNILQGLPAKAAGTRVVEQRPDCRAARRGRAPRGPSRRDHPSPRNDRMAMTMTTRPTM